MQQEKNLQKQQELNTLEELVLSGSPLEDTESEHLKQLPFKYPYQTLQLIKNHELLEVQPEGSPIVKAYIISFCLTYANRFKFQRYLVIPPKDEKEQKEFDRIVELLEDMIYKQTSNN